MINLFDENFYNIQDYENEEWVPMEEFGNEFYVSNYGRIKRKQRVWYSGRKSATVKTIPESIVKQRQISNGYIKTTICYNGVKKSYATHRLVAIHFIPNPDNLPQVNHIDGDKTNNSVSNLEWVTASQNMLHASRVLHRNFGKLHKDMCKDIADKIRDYKKRNPNASYNQISKVFGRTFAEVYGAIIHNTYSK